MGADATASLQAQNGGAGSLIRSGEFSVGVSHQIPPSSEPILCVPARVLEEVISISFWPAVDAGLPGWPTQYKHTIILFTLEAPLSLKLHNALQGLLSFLLALWSQGSELMKKEMPRGKAPFLSLYGWFFQSGVGFACLSWVAVGKGRTNICCKS